MTKVDFAVSFRVEKKEGTARPLVDAVRFGGLNEPAERERGEEKEEKEEKEGKRIEIVAVGGLWVEGIARSYDVRSKVLYIDTIDPERRPGTISAVPICSGTGNSGTAENENAMASARTQPDDEGQCWPIGTKGGERRHGCARHVLDVKLLSCSSPQGQELFDQLQAFSCSFKAGLARASLDLAVDAAADLGALCRLILRDFVVEVIKQEVAAEACREERLAVAAERTATAAIGSVLKAAERAIMLRKRFALGSVGYGPDESSSVTNTNAESGKEKLHRTRASISSFSRMTANGVAGTPSGQFAAVVDKVVAAKMSFRCTTIVNEKRRKAPRDALALEASGVGVEGAPALNPDVVNRRRHDLQYVARWM